MEIQEIASELGKPWLARPREAEILEELRRGQGPGRSAEATRRPTAALLTCVDERIVPETIFGCRPGTLYCVRLAGHVVSAEVVSSLEIALGLGCRLVFVLGHSDCGAVRLERERPGEQFAIVQHIRRATWALPLNAGLDEAIEANVRHSVMELRSSLRARIEGGVFDLKTSRLTILP
jgi:carbonic anhydrase